MKMTQKQFDRYCTALGIFNPGFIPLINLVEDLMADIAQIQADIQALQAAQADASAELQQLADTVVSLQDSIQSGVPVTQEQLDNLSTAVQGVTSALRASIDTADSTVGPPQVNPLEGEGSGAV